MPNEGSPTQDDFVEIRYTPEFKRNIRQLAKKYRKIRGDLQPLIDQLLRQETPGDRIPGIDAVVYKVRIRNSDARRGTRGGYRVVYYLQTSQSRVLLTIYSKTEQGDVSVSFVRQMILDAQEDKSQDSL